MNKLRVLDLFSGIGGFSLGLERTGGFETVAFCEIDKMCHKILEASWPGITIYDDINTMNFEGCLDVITGGFPCQDLSFAGNKIGIQGERSGLYEVMLHLVGKHKPQFVIFENVTALLTGDKGRWFSRFLNDLARYRYDAQWHDIPASAVGAIHHRDRVWIVAYTPEIVRDGGQTLYNSIASQIAECWTSSEDVALFNEISKIQFDGNEPDHRAFDGIAEQSHYQGSLGNSVYPKIPEIIGNAILSSLRVA